MPGIPTVLCVCITSALMCVGALQAQTVVYANAGAPSEGDGTSWASPHKYLAAALSNAAAKADAGQTVHVWIAAGTYLPDQSVSNPAGGADASATFLLHNRVSLYGGFLGGETSLDQRDPATNIAKLTGTSDFYGGAYHVVTAMGVDSTAMVDGLHLSSERWHSSHGKAAWVDGSPVFRNCTIADIECTSVQGGGVHCAGGNPLFEQCTFRNINVDGSWGQGSGLYSAGGAVTVRACLFENNKVDGGGAGICQNAGSILIEGCVFRGNTAGRDGFGAALLLRGSYIVRYCQFINNWAWDSGGAIGAATPGLVEYCSFMSNSSHEGAGGVYGEADYVNCNFYFNAGNSAGAISGNGRRVKCLFVGNTAKYGGGVYGAGTNISCLFMGNQAQGAAGYGDGTYVNCVFSGNRGYATLRAASSLSLVNCSFYGNSGPDIRTYAASVSVLNSILYETPESHPTELDHFQIDGNGTIMVANSFVQGLGMVYSGNGNIGGSPFLTPRYMDPDGEDGVVGTADDNLNLYEGSHCIDAGDSGAFPNNVVGDAAGRPRFVDDPWMPDAGSLTPPVVDMGAFEYQNWYRSCIADIDGDSYADGADYDLFNELFEAGDRAADLTRDGFVDGLDYDLFNNIFEAGCPD